MSTSTLARPSVFSDSADHVAAASRALVPQQVADIPGLLTVVIPIHNEAEFLPTVFSDLVSEMNGLGRPWDLLLVENGSSDGTFVVASAALAASGAAGSVMSLATPDYGGALRAGFLAAVGDHIAMFDIDYFSGEFVRKALAANADVVIASKRAAGSDDQRSLWRRLATAAFNLVLRLLVSSKVGDTHGMKVFRTEVIRPLIPQVVSSKDLFDTELVLRAERAGASIVELPVVVSELRAVRSSLLRRVPRTLRGVWRMRRSF